MLNQKDKEFVAVVKDRLEQGLRMYAISEGREDVWTLLSIIKRLEKENSLYAKALEKCKEQRHRDRGMFFLSDAELEILDNELQQILDGKDEGEG